MFTQSEPKRLYPNTAISANLCTAFQGKNHNSTKHPQSRISIVFNRFITPKSVIAATVAACVFAVAAIGTIGAQSYFAAQAEARFELSDATADAAVSERNVDAIVLQAEQAITAAQAVLTNSDGKTLDATAREQLKETLDKAIIQLELLKKNGSRIDERVLAATRAFNEQILWPPTAEETAK